MKRERVADPATLPQLRWAAGCLGLALAPHLARLPLWLIGVTAALVAMRLLLAVRGRPPPPRPIRFAVAGIAVTLLFMQFHTFNGLASGSALLCLMAGLKFFETRSRRDVYVVTFIVYFLSLAALLRGESLWLLVYLSAVAWLSTTSLLNLTPDRPRALMSSMRRSGRIFGQALPLAAILWLFFPRFDGPLWQLPQEASAESGLSDSMSPGDITELALSDEIAFRVHYLGPTPPPATRYWRGPVLHDFDGRTWRHTDQTPAHARDRDLSGARYRYRLSLEPHAHNWIFALDWTASWDVPRAGLTRDGTLVQPMPVSQPLEMLATAYSEAHAAGPLAAPGRTRDTALPGGNNPRTLELALELHRTHPAEADYVRAVLDYFHDQPFYYTLTPPALEENPVDEFLFDTRRGFCGHYASAFTVLMRAAGIPARIVTGYVGGTYNRYADYWIVRQSDAHAWTEIWREGQGWSRVDPTSAVALERVERGVNDAVAADEPLASRWQRRTPWLGDLRLRLDALHELWRQRILHYDQRAQTELLRALHVPEPDAEKLVAALGIGLGLTLAWLTWQVRRELKPAHGDPLVRAYERLCRRLAAVGLERPPHEGAASYAERVARARPDLSQSVRALCDRYIELRYGPPGPSSSGALAAFIAAVRAFRPRRARAGGLEAR